MKLRIFVVKYTLKQKRQFDHSQSNDFFYRTRKVNTNPLPRVREENIVPECRIIYSGFYIYGAEVTFHVIWDNN